MAEVERERLVTPPATIGDVLFSIEIDLSVAARHFVWAAVPERDFDREAKIVYLEVARIRARRRAAA